MKKSVVKEIFKDIKFKLVSADLSKISESFKEKGRNSRDFIEVKTLSQILSNSKMPTSGNVINLRMLLIAIG